PNGSRAWAVAVQPDSAIIAAGSKQQGPDAYGFIGRLDKTSGGLDNTFNTYVSPGKSSFSGVAITPVGRTIRGGTDQSVSPPQALLVRVGPGGLPDMTFGSGGVSTFDQGSIVNALVLQASGHSGLAGESVFGPGFYAARASRVGGLDWDFVLGT